MLIIKPETSEIILIEAEKKELEILTSTCQTVIEHITGGFHARIGANKEEVIDLVLLIKRAIVSGEKQANKQSITKINLSLKQLRIISQILNEACNGIKIINFEDKIGTSKDNLRSFLYLIKDSYKSIKHSRAIRQTLE